MKIKNIYLGYWYQRTTLHLSEMYDFFYDGNSPLALDHSQLEMLRSKLEIEKVEMKIGYFEYIDLHCAGSIHVKIYEDGLVVFENDATERVSADLKELNIFFEEKFNPAQSYLFSLGAPVPKELAGIKTISPFFIVVENASEEDVDKLFKQVGEEKYYQIDSKGVNLYRGKRVFVLSIDTKFEHVEELIEMQIFFKEFKTQLHRYVNMHRIIWEKIAVIKEQGDIRGKDVDDMRNELESYKKSIDLIDGRIQQMGTHMKTRQNIIQGLEWEQFLTDILQFKYGTLSDTHNYIKSLWGMTKNYVDSAIGVFADIQNSSTKNTVKALTLITTIGVVSGILRYLSVNELPKLTYIGAIYFSALLVATWLANKGVNRFYQSRKYKIKNIEAAKDIVTKK